MNLISTNFPQIDTVSARILAKKIVVSEITKSMYDNDNSQETVKARELENYIVGICQLLDVTDVFIAESGSALDVEVKADIGIELKDGTCLILQVKSSEQAAKQHINKVVNYKGRKYPAPSVIWVKDKNTVKILQLLVRELNIPISNDVKEAVSLARKLKGKSLPIKMLNLSYKQIKALNMLNLAKVKADQIVF